MAKGIIDILMMIPKGGKYAKSVVNFIHKAPKSWSELKQGIKQIEGYLKKEDFGWTANRKPFLKLIKIF